MKIFSYTISLMLTLSILTNCSSEQPVNLPDSVDQYIAEDRYEEALELIENSDPSQTDTDLDQLREKTYLNYGLYLEYRGPESSTMRERMTSALEQYIEVLRINLENRDAIAEIEQIMGIYGTMPDRSPDEEIVAELNELGFDY